MQSPSPGRALLCAQLCQFSEPPRPGQRGSPRAAHSPNPFMAEPSSLAATFSPRYAACGSRPALAQTSLGTAGELARPGWGDPSPQVSAPVPCGAGLGAVSAGPGAVCVEGGALGLGAVCTGECLLGLGAVCVAGGCVLGLGGGSHVPWGRRCAEWGLFIGGVGSRAGLHLCVQEGQDPLCVSVCWSVDGAGEPQLCLPDGPAAGERHSRCRHLCFEPCLSSVSSLAQSQWQLGPSIPPRGFPQHPASP